MQYELLHTPILNRRQKQARHLIGLQEQYKHHLRAVDYLKSEIENIQYLLAPHLSKTHENEMSVSGHVLRLESKPKFDLKRFKKEHPDMYENYCDDENYKIKIEVEK
jgi:hypothetical protein